MQTGVVVLAPPPLEEANQLTANLQARGIPVFQCNHRGLGGAQETIRHFFANSHLESVVVCNISAETAPDFIRRTVEDAGLGRHAVCWVDLVPLLKQGIPESKTKTANAIILVNVARLQRADHIRHAVFKMMARYSKVSRRDLFRAIPRVLRVESDIPIIFADRCRDRSRSCSYCFKACPVNAVSAANEAVRIDDRSCIECGACARDCPTGAIQSPSISDAQITAMMNALVDEVDASKKRAMMLTCPIGFERLLNEGRRGKHLDTDIIPVQIPCVSTIGGFHYISAASLGLALVTVCPDISCSKAVAMFPLYQHAESSKDVLNALRPDRLNLVRHLGLHANDPIADLVSQSITPVSAAGAATKLSGTYRREIIADAVRALRPEGTCDIELSEDSRLPLFDLKVDSSRCTFCEACQRDCLDHAIEFPKSTEGLTLMFDPASCSGCGICQMNCPEKAITVSRLRNLSAILERTKVMKAIDKNAKCERCGAVLGSKRSMAALRKTLSDKGATEATLAALNLCIRCKQNALIQPFGQHMQV